MERIPFKKKFTQGCLLLCWWATCSHAAQTLYQQGDPTGYEQLTLELINRARADPLGEAARYGLADLNSGLDPGELDSLPKQPLAFNPFLIASARAHSQWMIDEDTFAHTGINGTSPMQRMELAGYDFYWNWGNGENIAGYFGSSFGDRTPVIYDHHEGLFLSPGHRINILGPEFDEIGVGEMLGAFSHQGKTYPASSLLTQNFAYSWGSPVPDGAFLTGVVYEDLDNNGFYTPGEGIAGVEIRPDSGSWYAITSASGGYAIPVGFDSGQMNLMLRRSGVVDTEVSVSLPGSVNVKADFIPGVNININPWTGAVEDSQGWYALDWFGWFTQPHSAWVYHFRDGFQHYMVTSTGELFLFDPEADEWSWTTTSLYPIRYRFGENVGWTGL
jgi:hypothetical protein